LTMRRLWAAGIGWARISFLAPERPDCPATSPLYRKRGTNIDTNKRRIAGLFRLDLLSSMYPDS
jgi:hypothetical protein